MDVLEKLLAGKCLLFRGYTSAFILNDRFEFSINKGKFYDYDVRQTFEDYNSDVNDDYDIYELSLLIEKALKRKRLLFEKKNAIMKEEAK